MRILLATAVAAVSLAAVPLAHADKMGPDWVSSDNVEYLGSIKDDFGLSTGARVVGDRLFVTSGKNISIYDITDPAAPKRLGMMGINISWENEEVATNGEVLVFASDFYNAMPSCAQELAVDGCVQFFDVRDPSNIREVASIPQLNHTAECALDCQYVYGEAGTIIDARDVLEGRQPTVIGNWITELRKPENGGVDSRSCHHIREIRPGVLLTACQPFSVFTINPEDAPGASPTSPKVLAVGEAAKFVHSARWPRGGTDKFVMTGGELNFRPQCSLNDSEFSTYSAESVLAGTSNRFELLHQVPPAGNGTYVDGKPVANHLGCSVHWFQEHPTFRNGGLVALSEYEDGVRFMQIHPDGSIEEQGFFLPLGGSSSSPKWAPSGDVVYSIDYDRGLDIIRWKGEHYVPESEDDDGDDDGGEDGRPRGKDNAQGKGKGLDNENGTDPGPERVEGTEGESQTPQRLNQRQAARRSALGAELRSQGWSPGLCRLVALRNS